MWNTITTTFDESEPEDIVDRLLHADQQQRKTLEGAMIIGDLPGKSIFLEAAEEIEKLRRVLNITEN